MSCQRCDDLCIVFPIRAPADLRKAIAVAGDNLRDGTLEEIALGSSVLEKQLPFSSVTAGAQVGDLVLYRFRCTTCGELFSLSAETFHGSGGAWCPDREGSVREAL